MIKRIRHYYGSFRITAAAEIQLVSPQRARVFYFSGNLRQKAEEMLSLLCQEYPFIRYEIKEAVLSTSISLFTYQNACADTQFLSHLQDWFRRLIEELTESGDCAVLVQCSGRIGHAGKWQNFSLLNKGIDVQYKITGERAQGIVEQVRNSPYCRIGLTVLLIFVLLWCLYDGMSSSEATGQLI